MFQGMLQLRGGHCFIYDLTACRMRPERWTDLDAQWEETTDATEAVGRFRAPFNGTAERHLRADVEVGSYISGGLDSSAIVCAAKKKLRGEGGSVRQWMISSCFEGPCYDERQYIDAVVEHCQGVQAEKVFPRVEELMPNLRKMV